MRRAVGKGSMYVCIVWINCNILGLVGLASLWILLLSCFPSCLMSCPLSCASRSVCSNPPSSAERTSDNVGSALQM